MMANGHIRLAPARPEVALTREQVIEASKAGFYEARRAYAAAQARFGALAGLLFDRRDVTYTRLNFMRTEARSVVEKALLVEAELTKAIEAMEAARPAAPTPETQQ